MKLKWLGHSCFLITADNGVRILMDPFDESVGYKVPEVEADIVTTSHGHADHNYTKAVQGTFAYFNTPGQFTAGNITIQGTPTFHDEVQGAKRGKNIMFKFSVDGMNICHCGDLGHLLTPEQVDGVGPVDILLIPVGGFYTIDAAQAAEVCKALGPTVVVPMHFKTPCTHYPIEGVDNFLEQMGGGKKLGKREIEITTKTLADIGKVIVLDYE